MAYKSPFEQVQRPGMPPSPAPTLSTAPKAGMFSQPLAGAISPTIAGLTSPGPRSAAASPSPDGEPPPCVQGCASYPAGHPCRDILNCENSGTGNCPPGTPAGPASCCPPNTVYRVDTQACEAPDARSIQGLETCDESQHPEPRECYWCDFDTATWKRGWCGNAGGGGGGGTGGSGAPRPIPIAGQLEGDIIWQEILKRLQAGSRYTPEVMSSLLGEVRLSGEKQAANQRAQAQEGFTQRGMLRAPLAAAAERDITAGMYGSVLSAKNTILKAKVDADYADKSAAIEEGLQWLNSLRQYVASMSATQAQKDAAMANIQLGYARLQQELAMLREQYAQRLQYWQITGQGA